MLEWRCSNGINSGMWHNRIENSGTVGDGYSQGVVFGVVGIHNNQTVNGGFTYQMIVDTVKCCINAGKGVNKHLKMMLKAIKGVEVMDYWQCYYCYYWHHCCIDGYDGMVVGLSAWIM